MKVIYYSVIFIKKVFHRFIVLPFLRSVFLECGANVYVGKNCSIDYRNTIVGNNTSIGANANFMSTVAKIVIGNDVMIAPNCTIVTGDHRIDVLGRSMISINENEKKENNDQDVVIEDDVWVGTNTVILKGVRVGRGSIIAAGSIVTKDIEKYGIYAGVPAKKIKNRFSDTDIAIHENLLKSKAAK